MNSVSSQFPTQLKTYSNICIFSCTALVLSFSYYSLLSTPANFTVWAVKITPLLLFLPALLKYHPRAHAWLCFVILIYFTQAVLTAYEISTRIEGLANTALCVLLFTSSTLFIRCYKKTFNTPL